MTGWRPGRALPRNWWKIRAAVLDACGHQCQREVAGRRCKARAVEVDHINDPNDHSLANLQGLCEDHHRKKTQAQAAEGRRRYLASRKSKRKPEPHPGDRRDRR